MDSHLDRESFPEEVIFELRLEGRESTSHEIS
jgi:hypothetical protein